MPTHLGGWGAMAAVTLALPVLRLAPVTAKYRVDQSLTQEVDASGAGQGNQTLTFSTSTFVTVTLNDSAGGRTMRVVIDSVKGDSATPIPAISSADVIRLMMPLPRRSAMASTSEVCREMTRPEVYRSWNEVLSRWKWR